jgi:DnaJ-domain-containing protein 1
VNLPGRLSLTTLGDLLGSLHRANASGVLELVEPHGVNAGRSHRIYLSAGLVDGVETSLEHPRLGELLAREGALDREQLQTLLRRLVMEPQRLTGEILVTERLASRVLVAAALRWQLRERMDAIYRLRDALVRFHVRRAERTRAFGSLLTPRDFLYGRSRARIELELPLSRESEVRRRDAYRLLGLAPGSDAGAVRRAFRRLAAEHHPDRHPDATAAELAELVRRFSRLTAAYHTLNG